MIRNVRSPLEALSQVNKTLHLLLLMHKNFPSYIRRSARFFLEVLVQCSRTKFIYVLERFPQEDGTEIAISIVLSPRVGKTHIILTKLEYCKKLRAICHRRLYRKELRIVDGSIFEKLILLGKKGPTLMGTILAHISTEKQYSRLVRALNPVPQV